MVLHVTAYEQCGSVHIKKSIKYASGQQHTDERSGLANIGREIFKWHKIICVQWKAGWNVSYFVNCGIAGDLKHIATIYTPIFFLCLHTPRTG